MLYILSITSAFLLALSTPHLPLGPLIWIALTPLFVAVINGKTYHNVLVACALTSFLFHGFLFFGVKNYSFWIYLLTILLYSIPYILLGLFTFYVSRNFKNALFISILVAVFWFLVEKTANTLSLPYCIGLALYKSPWAGFASVIGASGLSALIVFADLFLSIGLVRFAKVMDTPVERRVNCAAFSSRKCAAQEAQASHRRLRRRAVAQQVYPLLLRNSVISAGVIRNVLIWLTIVWAPFLYGWWHSGLPINPEPSLDITVVQPNWGPKTYLGKGQDWLWRNILDLLWEAESQTPTDITLLPESFGVYIDRKDYLTEIDKLSAKNLIVGGLGYSQDRLLVYNSVYHLKPEHGIASIYNKSALIPLIEEAYATPTEPSQLFSINGFKLLPLICFESLIESRIQKRFKESSGFLLLANEAWFDTPALPFTHLASLVMRSIEYGRPAAMAGNTISMICDAKGRFKTTGYQTSETAKFNLHLDQIETPYGKFGYGFPYAVGLFVFGSILIRRVKK